MALSPNNDLLHENDNILTELEFWAGDIRYPGPWEAVSNGGVYSHAGKEPVPVCYGCQRDVNRYVAACEPGVIDALVNEVRKLRRAAVDLEKQADWLARQCRDNDGDCPRILTDTVNECVTCEWPRPVPVEKCIACWRNAASRATQDGKEA